MTPRTSKRIASQKRYYTSEKGKATRKRHYQSPERQDATKRYSQSPEAKAIAKRYCQSDKGKASIRKKIKRYLARHPNHYKAKKAVRAAIARGEFPPISSMLCVKCSEPAEQYHHYLGYAPEHWLNVIPLCLGCHTKTKVAN